MAYCDRIRKQKELYITKQEINKHETITVQQPQPQDNSNQHLLYMMVYARKLQNRLYAKYNLDLSVNDCYTLIKDIMNIPKKQEYEYFEYAPTEDTGYVELTSHAVHNKQRLRRW
jgi:hypothetical protein